MSAVIFQVQLRIASDAGQLLDMNRGEAILLHDRSEIMMESSKL